MASQRSAVWLLYGYNPVICAGCQPLRQGKSNALLARVIFESEQVPATIARRDIGTASSTDCAACIAKPEGYQATCCSLKAASCVLISVRKRVPTLRLSWEGFGSRVSDRDAPRGESTTGLHTSMIQLGVRCMSKRGKNLVFHTLP